MDELGNLLLGLLIAAAVVYAVVYIVAMVVTFIAMLIVTVVTILVTIAMLIGPPILGGYVLHLCVNRFALSRLQLARCVAESLGFAALSATVYFLLPEAPVVVTIAISTALLAAAAQWRPVKRDIVKSCVWASVRIPSVVQHIRQPSSSSRR